MGGLQAQKKSKKEFEQLIASWVHTAELPKCIHDSTDSQ